MTSDTRRIPGPAALEAVMPLVKRPTLTAQKLEARLVDGRLLRGLAAAVDQICSQKSALPKPECPLNSMGSGATSICAKKADQAKASLFSDLAATLGKI